MNRRVVKDMLDVAGAVLVEAESAEEGLAILEERRFDILLIDLRMPGMDGMTAIAHLRVHAGPNRRVPVIVVTADTADDLRDRCLEAGADDVLFKPVAMESLFDSMGRVLASRAGEGGLIA